MIVVVVACTARPARADESFALGARLAAQSIYLEGDGAPADLRGYAFGADAELRLARRFGVGVALEASAYDLRSDRIPAGRTASSFAPFLEAHADTNPDGPLSLRIDLGTGARWLALPVPARSAASAASAASAGSAGSSTTTGTGASTEHYGGLEPLRLRLGPSVRVDRGVELALLVGVALGWFSAHPPAGAGACAVTATCKDSLLDSDTQSSVHFTADLTLALRVWP